MHWITRESSVSERIVAYLIKMIPFIVLTVGSFVPCLYYGFYCEPMLQICYLCTIVAVGAGWYCLLIDLSPSVCCMSFTNTRFQERRISFVTLNMRSQRIAVHVPAFSLV